jgi:hypothetical protein
MDTKQYQKFWTLMVFLLSFTIGLTFLGAAFSYDYVVSERRANEAFQSSLTALLSIPSNCGGGISR